MTLLQIIIIIISSSSRNFACLQPVELLILPPFFLDCYSLSVVCSYFAQIKMNYVWGGFILRIWPADINQQMYKVLTQKDF